MQNASHWKEKKKYTCISIYKKTSYLIRRVTCYNCSKDTASRKQICKLAEALSQSRNFYTKFLSTINGPNRELKQTRFWLTHVNRKQTLHSWAVFLPKFSGKSKKLSNTDLFASRHIWREKAFLSSGWRALRRSKTPLVKFPNYDINCSTHTVWKTETD